MFTMTFSFVKINMQVFSQKDKKKKKKPLNVGVKFYFLISQKEKSDFHQCSMDE